MSEPLSYNDVASRFEPDGTLRDIYAFQTTRREWSVLLDALLDGPWPTELRIGDEPSTDIDKAIRFLDTGETATRLIVSLPDATLNCHFSTETEIEFDLNPSEINASNFDDLCNFTSVVSTATERNVYVTEEQRHEYGIFASVAATAERLPLHRTEQSTPLAATIRKQLGDVLRPFELPESNGPLNTPDAFRDPTQAPCADDAARQFLSSVFRPDTLAWHTDLTTTEYRALVNLERAFRIFFGSWSVEHLCRTSACFTAELRRQFWDDVATARSVFADRDA